MGVKYVEAFDVSLLVVHQAADVYQCFDGSSNTYLDKCLKIIALLMILLYIMLPGIKIQWRTIGQNKH
jgi:hypothetical protein